MSVRRFAIALATIVAVLISTGHIPVDASGNQLPPRVRVTWATGVAVEHDGPVCWNFRFNQVTGRPLAIVKAGSRAYRGAPCRGERILVAKLPWYIHEDGVGVYQLPGLVLVRAERP